MHRIPGSPKSPHTNSTKIPVLVMHGLMESSAGWVVMGPEKGLGKQAYLSLTQASIVCWFNKLIHWISIRWNLHLVIIS